MIENDDIIEIAKQVLLSRAFDGQTDNWLWDTAERIERNVNFICQSTEIQRANLAIDLFCLKAAVYFYQTGLIQAAGSSDALYLDLAELTRLSTLVVTEKLSKVVDTKRIQKINDIMIQACEKNTRLNEAKILSDAINLDDIGSVGIFNQARTGALHKKSISQLLNNYKKKADYGYWQARLNESFHFKNTAKIANKRFAIMTAFMQNLEKESASLDFDGTV
ncbi:MAG: hypothetical protein KAJ07_06110 [Planctomycetes bacterium]|nr:hypothetical protein [Planctomycetota bacterium]